MAINYQEETRRWFSNREAMMAAVTQITHESRDVIDGTAWGMTSVQLSARSGENVTGHKLEEVVDEARALHLVPSLVYVHIYVPDQSNLDENLTIVLAAHSHDDKTLFVNANTSGANEGMVRSKAAFVERILSLEGSREPVYKAERIVARRGLGTRLGDFSHNPLFSNLTTAVVTAGLTYLLTQASQSH